VALRAATAGRGRAAPAQQLLHAVESRKPPLAKHKTSLTISRSFCTHHWAGPRKQLSCNIQIYCPDYSAHANAPSRLFCARHWARPTKTTISRLFCTRHCTQIIRTRHGPRQPCLALSRCARHCTIQIILRTSLGKAYKNTRHRTQIILHTSWPATAMSCTIQIILRTPLHHPDQDKRSSSGDQGRLRASSAQPSRSSRRSLH
jgi:hypothetical protein